MYIMLNPSIRPGLDLAVHLGSCPPVAKILAIPLLALAFACTPESFDGDCGTDADCPSERPVCVVDVKTRDGAAEAFSYCAAACSADTDCDPERRCEVSTAGELGVCIDRVRACQASESLNGLDDDCDGVTDPAGAAPIERCGGDDACGAFVCQAPVGAEVTVCGPAEPGSRADFQACTDGSQCANGMCVGGFCSPICRPLAGSAGSDGCDTYVYPDGAERGTVCARGYAEDGRPETNLCQLPCATSTCPDGTECLWRDVFGTAERHIAVCATPAAETKPHGSACERNDRANDLSCRGGLCLGLVCTHICGGPGADCSDVGPGFECLTTELFYGTLVFQEFVCVEPTP